MKIITTITDRNHPDFGRVTETDIPDPIKPEFKTLTASEFIAMLSSVLGIARVDQLLAKSKTIETLLLKAEKVDRLKGNTPAAIAFLKTGGSALTDQELDDIDIAWRLL